MLALMSACGAPLTLPSLPDPRDSSSGSRSSSGQGVAISGRPLAAAVVDQRGEGKGTAYFSEEPRVFFMEVTSQAVEWTIAISERVR